MKTGYLHIMFAAVYLFTSVAYSEPSSGQTSIYSLRPYIDGTSVFLQTVDNAICNTNVFVIDLNKPSGKEAYALAMAAFMANKKIQVEVSNATGCTGWGTQLTSITIF